MKKILLFFILFSFPTLGFAQQEEIRCIFPAGRYMYEVKTFQLKRHGGDTNPENRRQVGQYCQGGALYNPQNYYDIFFATQDIRNETCGCLDNLEIMIRLGDEHEYILEDDPAYEMDNDGSFWSNYVVQVTKYACIYCGTVDEWMADE